MKTILPKAAALALVAGVAAAALIGSTSAQPKIVLHFDCFGDFKKSGETNNYACSKNFLQICKQGFQATNPVLNHLGGNKWKVSYGCYKPPA